METANTVERNGIQVIARAAAILRTLRDNPSGMSLGQIAERVALPRSTVQRIIGALVTERLVISGSKGGGVRLGPELGSLAEAARYSIVEQCRPVLAELTEETGETTDLSVLRGDNMIFLDQVPGLHRLRTVSFVGEVFPLTTTANGRACLGAIARRQGPAADRKGMEQAPIRSGDIASIMKDLQRHPRVWDWPTTSTSTRLGFPPSALPSRTGAAIFMRYQFRSRPPALKTPEQQSRRH